MKKIFDTYATNAFDTENKEWILEEKSSWIKYNYRPFFPNDLNAKILDIGPGMGELLLTLQEMGYQNAFGVDISPSVVALCEQRNLNCICVDDTTSWLNNHKGEFQLISVLDVIEHMSKEELIPFLNSCQQALTPTGILLLQVPNLQSPEGFLHRYNDITHEIGFVEHTIAQLLKVTDFKSYQFYPLEEYPADDNETLRKKSLRAFYWSLVSSKRALTHNLQPYILTPEFFVVATNDSEYCFLESPVMQRNNTLTLDDLQFFCSRFDLDIEAVNLLINLNDHFEQHTKDTQYMYSKFSEIDSTTIRIDEKLIEFDTRQIESQNILNEAITQVQLLESKIESYHPSPKTILVQNDPTYWEEQIKWIDELMAIRVQSLKLDKAMSQLRESQEEISNNNQQLNDISVQLHKSEDKISKLKDEMEHIKIMPPEFEKAYIIFLVKLEQKLFPNGSLRKKILQFPVRILRCFVRH